MDIAAMDLAAGAAFLGLIVAWLVLPLRSPVAMPAERERPEAARTAGEANAQTTPAASAAA